MMMKPNGRMGLQEYLGSRLVWITS